MKDVYIFDLDGTLFNCEWRLPLIKGDGHPDWGTFHLKSLEDEVIPATTAILRALHYAGNEIWFWTARNEMAREVTVRRLCMEFDDCFSEHEIRQNLRMRGEDDHSKDHHLKPGWFDTLTTHEKSRVAAIFDDRTSVVNEYRKRGIQVFQVADGSY